MSKGSAVLDPMQVGGVLIPVTSNTANHLSSESVSIKEQSEPEIEEVFCEFNVDVVSSENTTSTKTFSEIVVQKFDVSCLFLDDQPAVYTSATSSSCLYILSSDLNPIEYVWKSWRSIANMHRSMSANLK